MRFLDNLPIGTRVLAGCFAMGLLAAGIAIAGWKGVRDLDAAAGLRYQRSSAAALALAELLAATQAEQAQAGFPPESGRAPRADRTSQAVLAEGAAADRESAGWEALPVSGAESRPLRRYREDLRNARALEEQALNVLVAGGPAGTFVELLRQARAGRDQAAQDVDRLVAGLAVGAVADRQASRAEALREGRLLLGLGAAGALGAAGFALILFRSLVNPLRRQVDRMGDLALGRYETGSNDRRADEIGDLAAAMDNLSGYLGRAREDLEQGAATLTQGSVELLLFTEGILAGAGRLEVADERGGLPGGPPGPRLARVRAGGEEPRQGTAEARPEAADLRRQQTDFQEHKQAIIRSAADARDAARNLASQSDAMRKAIGRFTV